MGILIVSTIMAFVVAKLWRPFLRPFLIICFVIFACGTLFDFGVQTLRPKLPKETVPSEQITFSIGRFDDFAIENNGSHPIGRVVAKCVSPWGDGLFNVAERVNPGQRISGMINTSMDADKSCFVHDYVVYP